MLDFGDVEIPHERRSRDLRKIPGARVRAISYWQREFPALLTDRGFAAQALNPPRNKIERLISTREIDTLLRHPVTLDLEGILERGEILIVAGAKAAVGEDNTILVTQLLLQLLHRALQARAGPARRIAAAGVAADRRGPQRAHAVGREDARRGTLGRSRGRLRVAVLRADPRRGHPLRRPLAAAVDVDLPHARDRGRALARRPGDGGLLRPHLHRPGRTGTPAVLARRHPRASRSTRRSTSGSPTASRAPAFVAHTLPMEALYDERAGRAPPRSAARPRRAPPRASSPTCCDDDERQAAASDTPTAAQTGEESTHPTRRACRGRQRASSASPTARGDSMGHVPELPAELRRGAPLRRRRDRARPPRRVIPCAIQPRDVAIVHDVARYKFLTAHPTARALVARRDRCRPADRRLLKLFRAGLLDRFRPIATAERAHSRGPTASARRATDCCSTPASSPTNRRYRQRRSTTSATSCTSSSSTPGCSRTAGRSETHFARMGGRNHDRAAAGPASPASGSTTTGPPKGSSDPRAAARLPRRDPRDRRRRSRARQRGCCSSNTTARAASTRTTRSSAATTPS